jgi:hypothetical protein
MRTSLIEIKKIEEHILNQSSNEDALLFEAHLLLDSDLKDKLHWQKKTVELIHIYGRKRLKEELEQIHEQLFNSNASFRNKILSFFKSK